MEVHHLIGMREEHIKSRCLYCNSQLDVSAWHSYHHGETHYKVLRCSCGKTLSVKVGFHGSGHDSWSKRNVVVEKNIDEKNIDDRIHKLEQDSTIENCQKVIEEAITKNIDQPFNVLVGGLVKKFKNIESWKIMQMCETARLQAATRRSQFKKDLINSTKI